MSEQTVAPVSLAQALRALPEPRPDPGGWEKLQAELRPPRRARQRPLWALAAVLALAALLPSWLSRSPLPTATETQTAALTLDPQTAELARLQAESSRLDQWLSLTFDYQLQGATEASLAEQIIQRVQWIDATLASTDRSAAQLALWEERVVLLQRLLRLNQADAWLAASERSIPESADLLL